MPGRVKLAALSAFLLHGVLILAGGYRLSYDAYNHMFFAGHYIKSWWSLWEPRWYTGFEVASYPPLVHQVIAVLGRLTGVEVAYVLLLWAVLSAYPLAVYLFSRIFTGERAAGYAAMGAALLPSLYLTAHTFGQLPTLASTLLTLLGVAALADFLRRGSALTGALAVSLFAASMAGHHATLMVQPWLALAALIHPWKVQKENRLLLAARFGVFAVLAAAAMLAVVWPFWNWGLHQEMQTPIDHLSRHNFFKEPFAAELFFFPIYGMLIPLIPLGLWIGLRKRFWGLGIVFVLLFLLGLGGTTPLPRWVFGPGWAWLTYERFAFWASLALLPLLGSLVALFTRRYRDKRIPVAAWGLLAITGLAAGFMPSWLPTQPQRLDMQPVVEFLRQPGRAQYRYVTFGFGDQLAYLSLLTDATTIDGSYHTARTLPELRTSGIGQIDTAYWIPGGLSALDGVLQESGERGVRWGFSNLRFYRPVLERNGWVKIATLSNGVEVYENPAAVLPPPVQPAAASPFAAFSWGVFPLLSLFISVLLAIRRGWDSASLKVLEAVKAFAIGLLPVSLTFWYFRTLFVIEHERVYFTYSHALFYLSDGLALAAVIAWLVERLHSPGDPAQPRVPLRLKQWMGHPEAWLFGICLLASLSVFWSLEWRTSLYISLHLWLCFGLFLVLRDTHQAWRWFALGCCAALVFQFGIAAWEFALQSTAQTLPLGLASPGSLQPDMTGASVVQLAGGARWLRAYGTLPHPNLLGGFGLAMLVFPVAILMLPSKQRLLPVLLVNLGLALIALTFSRSAWLALAVLAVTLLAWWKDLDHKRLALLGLTGASTLAVLFFTLQPLFLTRLGSGEVQTEQVSNYTRLWLVERTVELIQQNPLLGTGAGTYPLALSRHVADFYDIEPVHNLPLLVASELGAVGVILLACFALYRNFKHRGWL
ncbi:MAG: hypothetical protein EHM70_13140 [Chloroflexota bacterium]|nr:MAG: hypothetical protein EHM70_13140 [Chloroflexota bacterium]